MCKVAVAPAQVSWWEVSPAEARGSSEPALRSGGWHACALPQPTPHPAPEPRAAALRAEAGFCSWLG